MNNQNFTNKDDIKTTLKKIDDMFDSFERGITLKMGIMIGVFTGFVAVLFVVK